MDTNMEILAFLIISIHKNIQKCKAYAVDDERLRMSHAICLYHIGKNKEGANPAAIASESGYDKAAISRSLSALMKMKLIRKNSNDNARYRSRYVLTEKGHEYWTEINRGFSEAAIASLAGFSEAEICSLISTLSRLNNEFSSYISREEADCGEDSCVTA